MPTQYAPIYDRLVEASSIYALPEAWQWLRVNRNCRQLNDAAEVFRDLTGRFPAEDLLESGVAQERDGDLVINPALAADEPGFIVLRDDSGHAFDVATAGGCLYGRVPALTMHNDSDTGKVLQTSENSVMYAAFSMADTILLRSLGVAVAPAVLLETLNLARLQRLLHLVDGEACGDVPKTVVHLSTDEPEQRRIDYSGRLAGGGDAFELVLLACSMTALAADIPESLSRVARHLANAERYLKFSWSGISVWYATQSELANMQYRRCLRSADALRRYLLTNRANYPLKSFQRPGPPTIKVPTPAETYFTLMKNAMKKPQPDRGDFLFPREDPQEARRNYQRFVDEQFVQPFVEQALRSSDPEDRALFIQMAVASRLFHGVMPATYDVLAQSAEDMHRNGGSFLPPEVLKQLESLGGQFPKLVREHARLRKERRHRWL